MNPTIGTCSQCGGRVTIPEAWMGTIPPIPTCEECGATVEQPHGPVLKMKPPKRRERQACDYRLTWEILERPSAE